jgi:hypothetical protein
MNNDEAHASIEAAKKRQNHQGKIHDVPYWLLVIEDQLNKAKRDWYDSGDDKALKKIQNIGSCSLSCLEQCAVGNSDTMSKPAARDLDSGL